MKRISIGFDLGVASVGWSVYNIDDDKLIDWGVKLFNQANKAEERRSARSLRRRYKRQNHRIERFNMLLNKNNIDYFLTQDNNLLSKRIKGIKEEISKQDLLNILRFFLKYRGYNPVADDTRENIYKDKYPKLYACEIQKIIYDETGSYRGLDFPFLIKDFLKEIDKLIKVQSKYHSFLNDDFIKGYKEILESRRSFWEGPGGAKENQLTPFGRYRNEGDLIKFKGNPDYRKYLYEDLIKDCSIYLGEKSAPVHNYYAQRFNFLNDMLNIRIPMSEIEPNFYDEDLLVKKDKDNYKFSLKAIDLLEEEVLNSASINYNKIFNKLIGIKLDKLSGYRIDSTKKPDITKFDKYKTAINKLKKIDSKINLIENKKLWNDISYYLTVVPNQNLKEILEEKFSFLSENEINEFIGLKLEGNYHSYSEKALKRYIEVMENTLENSSYIERKYSEEINSDVRDNFIINYFNNNDESNKMSKKYIDDLVASPQVKKSLRKAITTFNEIKKEYKGYTVEYIVVESNKELLPIKKQLEYITNQSGNENKRKRALKAWEESNQSLKSEKFIERWLLLDENNFKCVYCDNVIDVDNMEVEHILPQSKTADDSFANKSCACKKCNQDKLGRTPYQWYGGDSRFEGMSERAKKNKNFTPTKLENLLFTGNIDKYSKQFIARNLRDTAYVTKEFKNQLDLYKESLEYKLNNKLNLKVITMPPKITSMIRKNTIQKDRENKYHHAFDASIAAFYPTTKVGQMSNIIQNDSASYWKGDSFTDFMANKFNEKMIKLPKEFEKQLKSIDYSNTRFHFEIKKSLNGQLCNADINKVLIEENKKGKKEYSKVEYIADIYSDEKIEDLAKYFDLEVKKGEVFHRVGPKTLGLKKNDKPTFLWLQKIYKDYYGRKWKYEDGRESTKALNPFKYYACEENSITPDKFIVSKHGLRPESKNNKIRPVIKRLNYVSNVTRPVLLDKKDIKLNEGSYLMMDSVKTAYTKIYKNLDKGGYIFFPMYLIFFNLSTGKLNNNYEDHSYYKQLWDELIGDTNVEFYMDVRTNEYLVAEKKDGTIVEGCFSHYHKANERLEIKNSPAISKSFILITKKPIYGLGTVVNNTM